MPYVNLSDPVFDGFYFEIGEGKEIDTIKEAIGRSIGQGWVISRTGADPRGYDLTNDEAPKSTSNAWNVAYQLRLVEGIEYVEPLWTAAIPIKVDGVTPSSVSKSKGLECEVADKPGTDYPLWHLSDKQTDVLRAHKELFPNPDEPPGFGIRIGHTDTGYSMHPELRDNLLIEAGFDFVDDDRDPLDELIDGKLDQPGHGTRTASVIVSSPGRQPPDGTKPGITGVAPGAVVIPLRMTTSVLLFTQKRLAKAICFTVEETKPEHRADVISISLGGLWSRRLRKAIALARAQGVIIVAAAGNCVGWVVFPAAYANVLGMAACNIERKPWPKSSHGERVDVTAPGESVWRANVTKASEDYERERGQGTSFSAALTAGIAALWLHRHGDNLLKAGYPREQLPVLFRDLLRETATVEPNLPKEDYGAGLVNAYRVLKKDPANFARWSEGRARTEFEEDDARDAAIENGTIRTFSHLFERIMRPLPDDRLLESQGDRDDVLKVFLGDIFGAGQRDLVGRLESVGAELAFHVAVDAELYQRIEASLIFLMQLRSSSISGWEADAKLLAESVRGRLRSLGISTTLGSLLGD